MYNKQKIRQAKLHIRQVFLEKWDPIGIANEPKAQDEYDGYLSGVYSLLERGALEHEIVEHLHFIETVNMGMTGQSKGKLLLAAKALRQILI